MKMLLVVIFTAFVCWVMSMFNLRVESVTETPNGYEVVVSLHGFAEVHEVDK